MSAVRPASTVFVDTSALYAALDADDGHHAEAAQILHNLLDSIDRDEVGVLTHSSVVVEVVALVQHRLGMAAVRALIDDILPLLEIVWVDAALHAEAATALLAADRRAVSLVDWTSFVVMRRNSIEAAFAFDDDFVDQGFALVQAPRSRAPPASRGALIQASTQVGSSVNTAVGSASNASTRKRSWGFSEAVLGISSTT